MTTSPTDSRQRPPVATAVGSAAPASGDGGGPGSGSRLESFRRYTYWSMVSAAGALLLAPGIAGQVPYPPDPLGIVSWIAVLTVVGTLIPLIGRQITPSPERAARSVGWHRGLIAISGVASVVAAVTWLASGDDVLWAFAPAVVASVAIADVPRTRRRIAVAATMAVAIGVGVVVPPMLGVEATGTVIVSGAIVTAFALFLTLATRWTWEVAVQLDDARQQAATLAVANERLRFAADLHDIQGHHLQVIALKSELAGRLVDDDPDTARQEIAAVRQLAADALSDTRAVVQGYRRTSLDAEISNATSVLSSAGIDARLHVDPDVRVAGLPEAARHVLGLVVREAVTNVLRHSTATQADIDLVDDGVIRLTVTNDGAHEQRTRSDGGLQDLADRIQAAGGLLTWQWDGARFTVQATLPANGATGASDGDAGGRA